MFEGRKGNDNSIITYYFKKGKNTEKRLLYQLKQINKNK